MTPHELATRLIVLRVLADEIKAARGAHDDEVRATYRIGDRVTAELPDGTPIGSVTLTNPSTSATVYDEAAFVKWVNALYPHETQVVVREAFRRKLLDDAKKNGGALNTKTGEVIEIPGVEVSHGNPKVYPKPSDDAAEAVRQAWRDGVLELATVLREIEGHASE